MSIIGGDTTESSGVNSPSQQRDLAKYKYLLLNTLENVGESLESVKFTNVPGYTEHSSFKNREPSVESFLKKVNNDVDVSTKDLKSGELTLWDFVRDTPLEKLVEIVDDEGLRKGLSRQLNTLMGKLSNGELGNEVEISERINVRRGSLGNILLRRVELRKSFLPFEGIDKIASLKPIVETLNSIINRIVNEDIKESDWTDAIEDDSDLKKDFSTLSEVFKKGSEALEAYIFILSAQASLQQLLKSAADSVNKKKDGFLSDIMSIFLAGIFDEIDDDLKDNLFQFSSSHSKAAAIDVDLFGSLEAMTPEKLLIQAIDRFLKVKNYPVEKLNDVLDKINESKQEIKEATEGAGDIPKIECNEGEDATAKELDLTKMPIASTRELTLFEKVINQYQKSIDNLFTAVSGLESELASRQQRAFIFFAVRLKNLCTSINDTDTAMKGEAQAGSNSTNTLQTIGPERVQILNANLAKSFREFQEELFVRVNDALGFAMLVNPFSLQINYNKVISKQFTKGGIVFQHWGEDTPIATFRGTTGNIMVTEAQRQESLVFNQVKGFVVEEEKNSGVFLATRETGTGSTLLETSKRLANLNAFLNLHRLFRKNPAVFDKVFCFVRTYDSKGVKVLYGHLRDFNVEFSAERPRTVNYGFTMVVERDYGGDV